MKTFNKIKKAIELKSKLTFLYQCCTESADQEAKEKQKKFNSLMKEIKKEVEDL